MKDYKHFVDPVPVKTNWSDGMKFELVDSLDKLKSTFQPQKFLAWDTETTGLNPEEDHIVGFSYTYDGITGYYCPVDHVDLALGKESLQIFYKMLRLAKMTLLYNARFDIRFMEYSGFDMEPVKYIDIQNIVWLADTNMSFPSLKWAEKHFLGWEALHFEDTLGSAQNFRFVKARDAVFYAATDCLGTYNLFPKVVQYYRDSGLAARLDNECLFILMRLENEKQNLSTKYLTDLNNKCLEDLSNLERYLYKEAGYQFKIGSGRELTKVFLKLGIDTGERTKSGDMVTSIDKIENYLSSHESEFLSKLIEYKELFKFQNSYVKKLLDISRDPHPVRFSYKTVAVPTGRLSCGTDSKNTFFSKLNYQSIPKPHSHMFHCRKATDEEVANESDLCGYVFYDGDDDTPMIEGMSPVRNIRSAFVPDEGSVVLSVDMCAEELRIVANIFKEPVWIRAFNNGEDLHKANAVKIFGEENYCKEKRKLAKVAGFGILYGTSAYGFNQKFPEMTLDECEDFIAKFKRSIPNIVSGQQRAIQRAKKTGFVTTFFGRPRRVASYFKSTDPKDRSFACRTTENTLVQGAAADVLKLVLVRLWSEVFKPYQGRVRFMGTIHDEVNMSVPKEILTEVVQKVVKCMTIKLPEWPVTLECSVSIGKDFGSLFPFILKDGELIPDCEKAKEEKVEVKVVEEETPTIEDDGIMFNI